MAPGNEQDHTKQNPPQVVQPGVVKSIVAKQSMGVEIAQVEARFLGENRTQLENEILAKNLVGMGRIPLRSATLEGREEDLARCLES